MVDGPWIVVKNWERHQHYAKRLPPPWIKLHRSLLNNMEYRLLDPQYRALLIDLWLLAAEHGGKVKANVLDIAFRLRADSIWVDGGLYVLRDAGFITLPLPNASTALAIRSQGACLEKEESRGDVEEKETTTPLPPTGGVSLVAMKGDGHPQRYEEVRSRIAAVMAEVVERGRGSLKAEEAAEVQVQIVFAYWAGRLGHEGALLDRKRAGRIKDRLGENGGNVHELLFVVDGAKRSPHLMGRNDRNEKYDGIQTLFRDREQVEKLAALGGYKAGKEHSLAKKYAAIVEAA